MTDARMKSVPEDVRIDSLNLREILDVPPNTPIRDSRVGKHIEVSAKDCRLRVRPASKSKEDMIATALGCAGSQGHFRIYNSHSLMFSHIAYCVEKDPDGKVVIKRYGVPTETRHKLIELNDNPKTKPHPGGFDLAPIAKGRRVENLRAYDARRRKLQKAGKWKPDPQQSHRAKKAGGRPRSNRPAWLRSGSGLVHI